MLLKDMSLFAELLVFRGGRLYVRLKTETDGGLLLSLQELWLLYLLPSFFLIPSQVKMQVVLQNALYNHLIKLDVVGQPLKFGEQTKFHNLGQMNFGGLDPL